MTIEGNKERQMKAEKEKKDKYQRTALRSSPRTSAKDKYHKMLRKALRITRRIKEKTNKTIGKNNRRVRESYFTCLHSDVSLTQYQTGI